MDKKDKASKNLFIANPEFYCSKNKKASIENSTDALITNSTDY